MDSGSRGYSREQMADGVARLAGGLSQRVRFGLLYVDFIDPVKMNSDV